MAAGVRRAVGWLIVVLGAVLVTFAVGTVLYLYVEFDCPRGVSPCTFSLDSGTTFVYMLVATVGCLFVGLGWFLRRR